eukprot:3665050-Prymnesium_polylepis.1
MTCTLLAPTALRAMLAATAVWAAPVWVRMVDTMAVATLDMAAEPMEADGMGAAVMARRAETKVATSTGDTHRSTRTCRCTCTTTSQCEWHTTTCILRLVARLEVWAVQVVARAAMPGDSEARARGRPAERTVQVGATAGAAL